MTEDSHDADAAAELDYLRKTPAEDLLAHHFFVLAQWAAVHLAATPADLSGAQLVIDVMGAVLDAGEERLGAHTPLYRSALAEIQQVFVRASLASNAGPSAVADAGERPPSD